MEENIKNVIEKISSYNIFNNLFPGIVFCYILGKFTQFKVATDSVVENIFFYYFVGMIISRIGSVVIEKILLSIKVKNKKSGKKVKFIERASYADYIQASEHDSFIKTLNETNNTYRTIIGMLVSLVVVKNFEWLMYDYIILLKEHGINLLFVIVCVLLIVLFVISYKKQTDYIRKRVENYVNLKK